MTDADKAGFFYDWSNDSMVLQPYTVSGQYNIVAAISVVG
jgi:hypothetical protein